MTQIAGGAQPGAFDRPPPKGRTNRFVAAVLQSRAHWLLSRWVGLVCYQGRRSGRRFCTPTQYVRDGDAVLILVGNADSKTWWRNFGAPGGADLDVLVAGTWRSLRGTAVVGANEPERAEELLQVFLKRYPRAAKAIGGDADSRTARVVFVHCA